MSFELNLMLVPTHWPWSVSAVVYVLVVTGN